MPKLSPESQDGLDVERATHPVVAAITPEIHTPETKKKEPKKSRLNQEEDEMVILMAAACQIYGGRLS